MVLVEDDDSMRSALERLLDLAGYRVESFAAAENYLASGAAARADCLVCDVNLPGTSGFELVRCLAQAGSAAPVIFITAHDKPAAREEAARLGAAAYLTKPFEGRALVGAVKAAAQRR